MSGYEWISVDMSVHEYDMSGYEDISRHEWTLVDMSGDECISVDITGHE